MELHVQKNREAWLMRKNGASYREIGEHLGISRQRAYQRVAKYSNKLQHYYNTQAAIMLEIKPYQMSELVRFLDNCDLWI